MRAAMHPHFWLLADEPLQPLPSFFNAAARACVVSRALTFDMSGGTQWAKPAAARPLDGGVRLVQHAVTRKAETSLRDTSLSTVRAL